MGWHLGPHIQLDVAMAVSRQEEVATAWKVLRTEPIVLRLRFSLSQYLDGPGEWGQTDGVSPCGCEHCADQQLCAHRTVHRGLPAIQQGGLWAGAAAEEVRTEMLQGVGEGQVTVFIES